MNDPKVLVLGSTGMLGSALMHQLSRSGFELLGASRSQGLEFDAEYQSCDDIITRASLCAGDYIINCVGLTKTHIDKRDSMSVARAARLNVLFPIDLALAAENAGVKVIQIATDCVFSGEKGSYSELDAHDAHDVYGKTKSMGEAVSNNVMHLRCSLIGPEIELRKTLFFEWVRNSPLNADLDGYLNHRWNGLTSAAFSKIVAGIMRSGLFFSGVHHLVPADSLSKYDLVSLTLEFLGRHDVTVLPVTARESIDRTLSTINPDMNESLFVSGGFSSVPTIYEMMESLPWQNLRSSQTW